MYHPECPKCAIAGFPPSKIIRHGIYLRTSDQNPVQRYRCLGCKKGFSEATYDLCFKQKKRQKNEIIRKILASTGSLRRTAKILSLARVTVVRKKQFLGLTSEFSFLKRNHETPKAVEIEFDDLETFEHTKCKPLSVTLAVESHTRRILGLEVSEMPAKGTLTKKAKMYGCRPDLRRQGRNRLFKKIRPFLENGAVIKSDSNPHYPRDVKKHFPDSPHIVFKGRRGASGGQGELKKVRFDPLFSLNHTCAMLRANVNRLIRKTWCTTKSKDRLYAHLMIYADYHNDCLIKRPAVSD
jgi:transposase-like protein